jgi:DNA-binding NtrC family response regulator
LLEQAGMLYDGAVLDVGPLRELLAEVAPPAPPTNAPAAAPGATAATSVIPPTPAATGTTATLNPSAVVLPEGGFDLDTWTRTVVQAALAKHQGSPVRTAAYLGVTRKVLYTLRKRYNLIDVGEEEPT